MKKPFQNRIGKDLCDKFHHMPGDTSEGRWVTILLSLIGVGICVLDFILFQKVGHTPIVMICLCLFNTLFTYIELTHLFIRKYWFRYHRNLAISLCLLIYCTLTFLTVYLVSYIHPNLHWDISYIYIPFFFMPPIVIVSVLFFCFLFIAG